MLTVDRAIQRAKTGKLVDARGGARCDEISNIRRVDEDALKQLTKDLPALEAEGDKGKIKEVKDANRGLQKQIDDLILLQQLSGCI